MTDNDLIKLLYFRTLASSGKELKDPFHKALAQREEANRSGKMTVSCSLLEFHTYIRSLALEVKESFYYFVFLLNWAELTVKIHFNTNTVSILYAMDKSYRKT